ncbi:MAG: primosomal replication protein N [Pseudomonadales bacterium]|nr:primosomal replication protein N [Pseudomonadales bacterium]
MQHNQLEISGVICEVGETNRSPSGVPHTRFMIDHRSTQIESGQERKIECRISVLLSGDEYAQERAKLSEGSAVHVVGFLTKNSFRDDPAWTKLLVTKITFLD